MTVTRVANESETESVHVLIRRCAYREAVEEAARILGPDLGCFAMAMLGDEALAQQMVRETLRAFFDEVPTLETAPLRPWLFGCAYRLCVQQLTRQSKQQRADALLLVRDDDGRLPPDAEAARSGARRIRAGLEHISPRARAAGLLRYTGRLAYIDIATICGLSEDDACAQTGRALAELRDAVEEAPAP